jgi:hypothetical protein
VIALGCFGIALPSKWAWVAGGVTGAFLALYLTIRDDWVPSHIQNWRTGAEGERRTARELTPLASRGWTLAHDLVSPYGNVDHLVVGPAGAYVLDSKVWSGTVEAESHRVCVTWPSGTNSDQARLIRAIRAACAANATALKRFTGRPVWVTPVIVVWADFPAGHATVNGVEFVRGDQLRNWLEAQPHRLQPESVELLSRFVPTSD